MNSLEIELLGRMHEQDALADSLGHLSEAYKNTVSYPEVPVRSEEQEEIYAEEIATALAADLDKKSTETCTAMRKTHEASRTQRDFEILKAGRKKLMQACLNAAVWRWEKLGRQIKAVATGENI